MVIKSIIPNTKEIFLATPLLSEDGKKVDGIETFVIIAWNVLFDEDKNKTTVDPVTDVDLSQMAELKVIYRLRVKDFLWHCYRASGNTRESLIEYWQETIDALHDAKLKR